MFFSSFCFFRVVVFNWFFVECFLFCSVRVGKVFVSVLCIFRCFRFGIFSLDFRGMFIFFIIICEIRVECV